MDKSVRLATLGVPVSGKRRNIVRTNPALPATCVYFRCIFPYAPVFWLGTLAIDVSGQKIWNTMRRFWFEPGFYGLEAGIQITKPRRKAILEFLKIFRKCHLAALWTAPVYVLIALIAQYLAPINTLDLVANASPTLMLLPTRNTPVIPSNVCNFANRAIHATTTAAKRVQNAIINGAHICLRLGQPPPPQAIAFRHRGTRFKKLISYVR